METEQGGSASLDIVGDEEKRGDAVARLRREGDPFASVALEACLLVDLQLQGDAAGVVGERARDKFEPV
jgi:hypothetical protein